MMHPIKRRQCVARQGRGRPLLLGHVERARHSELIRLVGLGGQDLGVDGGAVCVLGGVGEEGGGDRGTWPYPRPRRWLPPGWRRCWCGRGCPRRRCLSFSRTAIMAVASFPRRDNGRPAGVGSRRGNSLTSHVLRGAAGWTTSYQATVRAKLASRAERTSQGKDTAEGRSKQLRVTPGPCGSSLASSLRLATTYERKVTYAEVSCESSRPLVSLRGSLQTGPHHEGGDEACGVCCS